MNTQTDVSGLVAVAWQHSQRGLREIKWQDWHTVSWKPQGPESEQFRMRPLCVLSDAEKIIAAKDAEIERLRGCKFSDRNYSAMQSRLAQQAERIKEQSAALKLAKEGLTDVAQYANVLAMQRAKYTLAAIDALGE